MENKVAHCPKCQKPVVTEGQFNAPVKFSMKCPFCQERLQVRVMIKMIVELFSGERSVEPSLNDDPVLAAREDNAKFNFALGKRD